MKKVLLFVTLLIGSVSFGQAPHGINYQAVAYDSEGFEISNQNISVRLGILLGGVDAEASYIEVHYVTTDDFGLFSLVISQGETSDTFSSINWEQGAYLKVEVDANLDGEYSVMGVSSFNAVPYALYAPTDNRVDSLISLFEYKIELMTRPLQESLDLGVTFQELYAVGFIQRDFIGLHYQGGIIFYFDDTNEHGLIAANTSSVNIYDWGCNGTNISGADGQAIGTGYQNTLDIVAGCSETPIAASEALAYESEGYSDWYLPSKNELLEMYKAIGNGSPFGDIGGFSYYNYWSSSQSTGTWSWLVNLQDGTSMNFSKSSFDKIHPIRSF
jgi:hypothetical protein